MATTTNQVESTVQFTERKDLRYEIADKSDLKIVVRRESQDGSVVEFDAQPLDISFNGMKVAMSRSLIFRERVDLRFQSDRLGINFEVKADVRWIRQGEDKAVFLVGFAFSNQLDNDFVDAIASGGSVDRRQSPRCVTNLEATVQMAGKPEPFRVTLLDLSATGVRFASSDSVEPNQPMKLLLNDGHGEVLEIGANSKWNLPYESGYFIGCEIMGKHRDAFETWRQGVARQNRSRASGRLLSVFGCFLIVTLLIMIWMFR